MVFAHLECFDSISVLKNLEKKNLKKRKRECGFVHSKSYKRIYAIKSIIISTLSLPQCENMWLKGNINHLSLIIKYSINEMQFQLKQKVNLS